MATGDAPDFASRLRSVLPSGWFASPSTDQSTTPVLDAVLAGLSASWAQVYGLLGYAVQQTRIATATDVFLDMISADFFGAALRRRLNEMDAGYRTRIGKELLRPRNTRLALIAALTNLTGRAPLVFEPARSGDTGGYGVGGTVPWSYNADFDLFSAGREWSFTVTSPPAYAPYTTANKQSLSGTITPALAGFVWTAIVEWIGSGGSNVVFGLSDGSGFSRSLYVNQSGASIALTVANAAGSSVTSASVAIDGTAFAANRIVVVASPGLVSFCANGGAIIQVPYSGNLASFTKMSLGCSPWQNDNQLTGAVARLTVYAYARSTADMQKLSAVGYQPGLEVPPAAWTGLAYNAAGGYGTLSLPFQAFITAYRPIGQGIAFLPGYDANQGGYGLPVLAYGSNALIGGQVTDDEIYATIANTMPAATIAWTKITSPVATPVNAGVFTLDSSALDGAALLS